MKNKIYDIRLARKDEYPALRTFLANYWGENHILVKSKEVFDFQYLEGEVYNIVVAVNKESGDFDAFWGIITTSKYDSNLRGNGDSWGALVKIRPDVLNDEIGGIAMKMLRWIIKEPRFCHFNHNGLGPKGRVFLMPYCASCGPMRQYYIANNKVSDFKVTHLPQFGDYEMTENVVRRVELEGLAELPSSSYKPEKSLTYIMNRYAKHPVYHYFAWEIVKDGDVKSVWILRKITLKGLGSVLRVVDAIGNMDSIGCIGNQVQALLENEGAEYVDFLNFGIPTEVFSQMGFEELDVESNTIIPNYFEPFESKNVAIVSGLDSDDGYVIFKGDGDQDRPNAI